MTAVEISSRHRPATALIVVVPVVAVGIRVALFGQISGDYTAFMGPWYQFIDTQGGLAALRFNFANYNPPYLYLLAAATALFAPSVVINSGAWAQCDSIYAAFCLGSLYFLLRAKPWWASIFFAIALSFKLQAMFFLPVLLIVFAADTGGLGRWPV